MSEQAGPWGGREEVDPEAGQAGGETEVHFPCQACGAMLTFAPGTDAIRCQHCGHENPIPDDGDDTDAANDEIDFRATIAALEEAAPQSDDRIVQCASCAAEFALPPDSHAGDCPYCGSSVVTDTGKSRQLKPASLIPFQIKQEDASARLAKWLKGLWFAPNGIGQYARGDSRFLGVYTPHWTFDAQTSSRYRGERGVFVQVPRTTTMTVNGKPQRRTVMVTETRWTRVRGFVRRHFDDVLVLASRNLPKHLAGKLFTWRLKELVPYRDEYLSGFRSEAYQVELPEGFEEAQQIMRRQIEADVRRDIGGNVQRIHSLNTQYGDISFKHVLLPIWVAAYRYRGKAYNFVINGQTGEVRGERPWSWIKIGLAVAAVAAIGVAAYFIFGQ